MWFPLLVSLVHSLSWHWVSLGCRQDTRGSKPAGARCTLQSSSASCLVVTCSVGLSRVCMSHEYALHPMLVLLTQGVANTFRSAPWEKCLHHQLICSTVDRCLSKTKGTLWSALCWDRLWSSCGESLWSVWASWHVALTSPLWAFFRYRDLMGQSQSENLASYWFLLLSQLSVGLTLLPESPVWGEVRGEPMPCSLEQFWNHTFCLNTSASLWKFILVLLSEFLKHLTLLCRFKRLTIQFSTLNVSARAVAEAYFEVNDCEVPLPCFLNIKATHSVSLLVTNVRLRNDQEVSNSFTAFVPWDQIFCIVNAWCSVS